MTNQLFIGSHQWVGNSLHDTIQSCSDNTIQIFTPEQGFSANDRKATAEYCKATDKRIFIHTHLYTNLAKPNNGRSVGGIKRDLKMIEDIPKAACVVHVGKHCGCGEAKGRVNIIEQLNKISFGRERILLENAAGQGTELGSQWDDIRKISEAVDTPVGLCLDTQHAFASGLCSFEDSNSVIKLLEDAVIPIKLIHLNDSKVAYGAKKDRHEDITKGYIWSKNDESLGELLYWACADDISVVLETHNPKADLAMIYTKYTQVLD